MEITPLVSIILPVFNGEKFLDESVRSLLNQSYKNFELIIINDGSTDKSKEIISNFSDDRILYYENETNIGLISTLNKGIELSKGKYIARMDADDISYENRLKVQVDFLEKNTDHMMCGGWAETIDNKGFKTGKIKRITSDGLIRSNILFTTPFIHPTILIKSQILKETNYGIDTLHCEDLDLWVRLSLKYKYKFANIPIYLIKYRLHNSNVSIQHKQIQENNRIKYILPFIKELIPELSPENIKLHFLSFQTGKIEADYKMIVNEKKWLVKLSKINHQKKKFPKNDLDSLLFSRWIVFCVKIKCPFLIPFINIPWFKPQIFINSIKLNLFK